jgi:SAM-dependent methyltransferase
MAGSAYDAIGLDYAEVRRTDPRIAAAVWSALGGAATVVNVGAGTGSYEPPDRTVLAVEPSAVMIAQRPRRAAPVVRAVAEALPLGSESVDAALAVLTVQHWRDRERGIAELVRVARRRVVVVTMDVDVLRRLWLVNDYLPDALADSAGGYPSIDHLLDLLPSASVAPIPVPSDCTDGFASAFWARPEAYLDPRLRAGSSPWHQLPSPTVDRALEHLKRDLESGEWDEKYGMLRQQPALDVGLRLIAAEKR